MMVNGEAFMSRVSSSSSPTSACVIFFLVVVTIGASSGVTTAITAQSPAQSGAERSTLPNLRLFSTSQHDLTSPLLTPLPISPIKNRKVREIARGQTDHEDDQQDYRSSPVLSSSSKLKGLYPSLTGSGELLRLFRPLAWSPEKTIGINRWYLPGVGYFSRGGRAASSNFIRFGRSDGSAKFIDDAEDGMNGGGDVTMLSRNSAKKKNNFIRLGRENPRQTNFIRLGRSGAPSQPGEFYNAGYITPALSDPFRDDEDGRHEFN